MERRVFLLGRRQGFFAVTVLLLLVIFLIFSANARESLPLSSSNATSGGMHREGYCSMYGICAQRSDGKVLNCASGSLSIKPDGLLSSKIQSLCPTIIGNACCNAAQFETLRDQVQQAVPLLVGCPACLRNFLNLFCELSCSPNQSLFVNVTSAKQVNNTMVVNGIDYFITETYGAEFYNSCKDVKFGSMNTRVMDFIGASAQNYRDFLAFLGRQAALNTPGSPYKIDFKTSATLPSGMKPINSTVYSCRDSLLGCSCGDCSSSSSSTCSGFAPPAPLEKDSCKVAIGSAKVKCFDFSLAVLYITSMSALLLWGFLLRKGERGPLSKPKSLFKNSGENEILSGYKQQNSNPLRHISNGPLWLKVHPSTVQDFMARSFRKYGAFVSRRPTLVLSFSLAVPVLICIGLFHFRVETKPEKLWVSHGSKAAEEKHFFDHHLAPFYRIEQLLLATVPISKNAMAPSIVTDQNLKLLFELQKKVDTLLANYSGTMVSLADICMKPLAYDCATQSVLQYFQMSQKRYDDYGGIQHVEYCFEHYSSEETCRSAFHAPLDPGTVLGGFSGSNYSHASAFIITYPVNNEVGDTGNENGKAVAWERSFIRLVKEELLPMVESQNLTFSFSSESSIQDELERESSADVVTILVSYLVMFAYISFTVGDSLQCPSFLVTSKVLLGLSGVLIVILSVLGSIGFYSAIGVKSTLIIMEVIPFLVLAVGVDNMCILVHAVKRQATEMALEGKISNALVEVGPSIILASLSEVVAFAFGSLISMPAVRIFSMFAALAVFLNFILQVTAFVALIIFDNLRANHNRIDCFPCVKLPSSVRSERDFQRKPGFLVRYMEDFHAPMLAIRGVKIVVIAAFTAATFLSIALCTRLQPGLEQKIVLPQDSYLQGYFDDLANYLRVGPPLYFVVKDFNYSLESNQTNKICSISQCDSDSLLNEITRASLIPESSFIAKPAASWLDDFLVWLSPEAFGCCRKFINGSYCPPSDQFPCCQPNGDSCGINGVCKDCTTCFHHSDLYEGRPSTAQFKEKLPWFLKASPSVNCAKGGSGPYSSSIDLTAFDSGMIKASSFRTYHTPLSGQMDFVNAMKSARDFSSRVSEYLKIQVFPYSVYYIYFEQYLNIRKTAWTIIAIGLGAVFIICLVITCSLWTSAMILLVLVMIVLDMMGVMAILKIQLNAISVVNLVMSVGIAVEFCVHITHAFLVSSGDRESRTKVALSTMGTSVFSGITLTKLVGVIVLSFAKSQVFVVYYFQMYLALVLIGFLHGLVFLPVLLSICGPPSRLVVDEKPEDQPTVSDEIN